MPRVSYLVCGTPRTGSNLLCGLLKSTGVAGHPEELFWHEFEPYWTERWGAADAAGYLDGAIRAGATTNGVFGAKLMWDHLPALFAKLAATHGNHACSDREQLERSFPNLRLIWIWREDTIAQAISLWRAVQTDVWTADEKRAPWSVKRTPMVREAQFDFDRIRDFVIRVQNENAAWRRWFAANRSEPFSIRYEDLVENMEGATRGVLDFLGVELPAGTAIEPRHTRQADDVSAEWAARYRAAVAAAG